MNNIIPDKKTTAVCGLLCKACGLYIATQNNDEKQLKFFAERLNIAEDMVHCNGCRSNVLSAHCKTCYFRDCIENKKIEFCSECNEYPCQQLIEFQSKMPHRVELFQSLDRIKEVGWEKWYLEIVNRHSCTKCNTINGWYNLTCINCGYKPSSPFAEDNFEVLSKTK